MIQEKQVNPPPQLEQKQEDCLKRIQQIKKYTLSELKELDYYELKELQKEAEELQLTKQCKIIQQVIIHQNNVTTRLHRQQEFYYEKSIQELEQLILQYESLSDPWLEGHINAMRLRISFRKDQQQQIKNKKGDTFLQFVGKNLWKFFKKRSLLRISVRRRARSKAKGSLKSKRRKS